MKKLLLIIISLASASLYGQYGTNGYGGNPNSQPNNGGNGYNGGNPATQPGTGANGFNGGNPNAQPNKGGYNANTGNPNGQPADGRNANPNAHYGGGGYQGGGYGHQNNGGYVPTYGSPSCGNGGGYGNNAYFGGNNCGNQGSRIRWEVSPCGTFSWRIEEVYSWVPGNWTYFNGCQTWVDGYYTWVPLCRSRVYNNHSCYNGCGHAVGYYYWQNGGWNTNPRAYGSYGGTYTGNYGGYGHGHHGR